MDAVNILDSARAQSRMGVLPAALIIQREVGLETVFHYTCRDRNMLGMMSDLLGAAAGGLRNVLIVTGDPPAMGPYPDSTAVFDIDSIGLTNLVRRLNQGLDPGGNPLGEPTRFVVGVALNQGADLEHELERFAWKVEAGADFAVTQPVFDAGQGGAHPAGHPGLLAHLPHRGLLGRLPLLDVPLGELPALPLHHRDEEDLRAVHDQAAGRAMLLGLQGRGALPRSPPGRGPRPGARSLGQLVGSSPLGAVQEGRADGSTPTDRRASSQTCSGSGAKINSARTGAVSQSFRRISWMSWPEPQPA